MKLELRIENGLGQALEREQADGLLLQLFDAPGAVLAGRREDLDHGAADGIGAVQAAQEQGHGDGRRVGDHVNGGFARVSRPRRLHRWGAQARVGPLFGGVGQVDDGRFGRIAEEVQRLLRGLRAAGQDHGARLAQAGGVERDDHGGFVADAR